MTDRNALTMRWWNVKVYDADTGTTTTLNIFAEDEEACRVQAEEDGLWEFITCAEES